MRDPKCALGTFVAAGGRGAAHAFITLGGSEGAMLNPSRCRSWSWGTAAAPQSLCPQDGLLGRSQTSFPREKPGQAAAGPALFPPGVLCRSLVPRAAHGELESVCAGW